MWTFRVRGGARLLLGTYGSHECRQEMGKIPNFTDSERLKTPKTDCMCAKGLQRQRAWTPGLLTLKIQGSVPPDDVTLSNRVNLAYSVCNT